MWMEDTFNIKICGTLCRANFTERLSRSPGINCIDAKKRRSKESEWKQNYPKEFRTNKVAVEDA